MRLLCYHYTISRLLIKGSKDNYDVRGRRHRAIGPTIASSRIMLASSSHSVPYVYSPCPTASICRYGENPVSALAPVKAICTSELVIAVLTPSSSPLRYVNRPRGSPPSAGITDRISKKNTVPTTNPSGRFLVYSRPTDTISEIDTLSIITTNRNRIAIAPTYTIRYEIPTNPTPSSSRYPAALTNTEIRNSTEITGFADVITRTPDSTAPKASRSSSSVFIVFAYM